jgi:hypothetical protein
MNMNETYRGREIEMEQLGDGKWIACAQGANGVMVVSRPGWHYETEEDAMDDIEALIDQSAVIA